MNHDPARDLAKAANTIDSIIAGLCIVGLVVLVVYQLVEKFS